MFGHDNQDGDENAQVPSENHDPATQAPADQQQDDTSGNSLGGFVATPVAATAHAGTDDLLDIKHEALRALSPLVGQLDQTPEERFRTTMMMIQASDDHSLVKVAYEAAKQITNEKERAQALLDIVNEINYFTQNSQS
ncbi:MAG TPA: hypothetical protein VF575_05150 [Candidatus Saccharimonadales bacterium]|jgi:hypothetical protein